MASTALGVDPGATGRPVTVAAGVVLAALFVLALAPIAVYAGMGVDRPGLIDGRDDAALLASLAAAGIPARTYVGLVITVQVLAVVAVFGAAALLLRGGRTQRFATVLALVLGLWSVCTGPLLSVMPVLIDLDDYLVAAVLGIAWVMFYVTFAFYFPDGRATPRWAWVVALVFFAWAITAKPLIVAGFEPMVLLAGPPLFAVCVGAQIHRYRHADAVQRQQIKWVLWALGLMVAYLMLVAVTSVLGVRDRPDWLAFAIALALTGQLVLALLGVSLAIAVLRLGLFGIDAVISRTLVWGALTGFIVLCFALIVGVAGLVWPAGTPVALPILATVVAAICVNPLRLAMQRRVNRRLYGDRDDPGRVLARLGDELSATSDLEGTLARIASTVAGTLRFPHVTAHAIADGESVGSASAGDGGGAGSGEHELSLFPIAFEGAVVGELTVRPRAGERLTPRDRVLLVRLTRTAGVAIHAAIVSERLRRSQSALVEARESERRRLHRDLHDGLGPVLASLRQRLDLIDRALDTDPARARALLAQTRAGLVSAIVDVRDIVDSLRPSALDQLGLVGAIQASWPVEVEVHTDGPLPRLGDAVEVGAYRIAMEAVSNAVRHSGVAGCRVELRAASGALLLEITDRGRGGISRAPSHGGLRTMRERAAELGGSLLITDAVPGTSVRVRLPIAEIRP